MLNKNEEYGTLYSFELGVVYTLYLLIYKVFFAIFIAI